MNVNDNKKKNSSKSNAKKKYIKISLVVILCFVISILGGFLGSTLYNMFSESNSNNTLSSDNSSYKNINNSNILSSSEVVKLVADSVVDIATELPAKTSGNKSYVSISAGSGVIYSSDGYIITNAHIVPNNKITVTLRNGTSYSATLVGTDSNNDIALLKINATNLSPINFGDSSTIEVGEETTVIGNPLGELGGTVTDGVVSAVNRVVEIDGRQMSLIQTSAEINSGNSGGGVFRRTGELIGIVVAKSSGENIEGLGFAIPSNTVKTVVKNLLK